MTAAVKTKSTKVEAPAPTPEVAEANSAKTRSNPAQAAESVRNQVAEAMAKLKEAGFTRPSISAVTGLSDSQVWRMQNKLVHTVEVPIIMDFIQKVTKGEVKPPERKTSKVSAAVLQERVAKATELLNKQAEAKSVTALRALVAEALEVLSA